MLFVNKQLSCQKTQHSDDKSTWKISKFKHEINFAIKTEEGDNILKKTDICMFETRYIIIYVSFKLKCTRVLIELIIHST